jgi:hypothetical protein
MKFLRRRLGLLTRCPACRGSERMVKSSGGFICTTPIRYRAPMEGWHGIPGPVRTFYEGRCNNEYLV